MILTEDMKAWLADHQEDLKQLIRDLCAIPAPSHHEERRAEFCKAWFEANGGKDVYIDEALNAVCPYCVTEDGPVMVFMAHTDTVFPDMEPMPFLEDETTFRCPGVCDDTTNLAVLMLCATLCACGNTQPSSTPKNDDNTPTNNPTDPAKETALAAKYAAHPLIMPRKTIAAISAEVISY